MRWSIIATTHNRAAELRRTLERLRTLQPAPDEILVCADGCTDETVPMLRASFPEVRLLENPRRLGSIPSRDRLLRTASGDLVLSLDDDSYPLETGLLAAAGRLFAADARLAVLWFPQRSEEFPASLQQTDFGPDQITASYTSSGAVLRRAAYLQLPGYATIFSHAYEEPDYGLQCVAADWRVRRHTQLTIRHHYSPLNRRESRTHHLHARNELWSILLRCPVSLVPFMIVRRAAGQFLYACRRGPGWVVREPLWWWAALRGVPAALRIRRPVTGAAYRRWLHLLRQPERFEAKGVA